MPFGVRPPPLSLTWKIFLGTAVVIASVLAGTLFLMSISATGAADTAVARGLVTTRQLVTAYLDARERGLENGAMVFAQNPPFRSLVMNRDRSPADGSMLDQASEAAERIGASWVQITDDSGVRLAKSDDPAAPGEQLSGTALVGGALGGSPVSGVGITNDSIIFQAVAVPITGSENSLAGVLMAARVIDSSLAATVKEGTESDIVFYAIDTAGRPRIAESTLGKSDELVAAVERYLKTSERPAHADSATVPDSGQASTAGSFAELSVGGVHFVGQGAPLRSAGGEVFGGFLALRSRDAEMAAFAMLRRRILISGAVGLVLAFALSFGIARRIVEPARTLAEAARRASQGDYSTHIEAASDDEIGTLARAFSRMLADLRDKQALVTLLSAPERPPAAALAALPSLAPDRSRVGAGVAYASRAAAESPASSMAVISSQTASAPAPGEVFAGRYRILEHLGKGGMGTVVKAVDTSLGEVIAIKVLKPEHASYDSTVLERFKSEIRLTRRISHPNVVRTYDIGEANGLYFITMEFVEGTPLDRLLETRGRLPVSATLSIAKQLCRALDVAHEQGVIHRDIKPANLLVGPDGVLKVMDFGVARLARRTGGVTEIGTSVGTPSYMSPEQLFGDDVDARADLFSVGVVLYECLTGRRPFEADSLNALAGKLLKESPTPPHIPDPTIPRALSDVVVRALSSDRSSRPQTAGEINEVLEQIG